MKELLERINEYKEDIKEIENLYLPDVVDIYNETESAEIKLNALNSIIGLKNQLRSDKGRVELAEEAYKDLEKTEVKEEGHTTFEE